MSEIKKYPVPAELEKRALINAVGYQDWYRYSTANPEAFWADQAKKFVTWFKPWDQVLDWSFAESDLHINWFKGALLNVAYNCLDRHLATRGE
ncbi:hypothetical protein TI04_13060, partial [Achromatium sp. WMS2]